MTETPITTPSSPAASTLEERAGRAAGITPIHVEKGETLAEAIKRTADPMPDPIEHAKSIAATYVHNICAGAQLSIRERRDELDNLTERMTKSEEALSHYIGEFASLAADVMKASTSMKAEIATIAAPFSPNPPATITQLKNGKE